MNLDQHYIYVFLRKDLPVRQQMLAEGHAIERLARWLQYSGDGIPNLILLEVANEAELIFANAYITDHCFPVMPWRDPDEKPSPQLRAIAAGPICKDDRKWFKQYRLYGEGRGSSVG